MSSVFFFLQECILFALFEKYGVWSLSLHYLLKQADKENDEVYTQLTLLPLQEVLEFMYDY